jgi:hypothetical protein
VTIGSANDKQQIAPMLEKVDALPEQLGHVIRTRCRITLHSVEPERRKR